MSGRVLDPDRCSEYVFQNRGMHHQCLRKITCVRNGKGYCKQHDPVAVKARQEASWAAYEQSRLVEALHRVEQAVRLLREKGYTVIPPSGDRS